MSLAFGSHMQGKGQGTLELKSVEDEEPAKLAAFAAEMDRVFSAQKSYHELYRKAETAGAGAEAILTQAGTILKEARAEVTLPEPMSALDEAIKNHETYSKHQSRGPRSGSPRSSASRRRTGRSRTWRVGRTRSDSTAARCSSSTSGIEAADGACAMPQVKELAKHYRGRPVAVFGMNNDRVQDDAKFVAREMQLDYPVLLSQELPGKYGVSGFPTLIVVDQQGNVSDIHVGYSDHPRRRESGRGSSARGRSARGDPGALIWSPEGAAA